MMTRWLICWISDGVLKVDTLRVRKLHTIRSQLTDMSLGTTGRQLQLQHRRWHSHGYRLPAISSALRFATKRFKRSDGWLGRYFSWTWSNLYKISLWIHFFPDFQGLHLQKCYPGDPWFSVPKSMSLIYIPCSFIRSLGMSRRQGNWMNPSEKMMCRCAHCTCGCIKCLWSDFLESISDFLWRCGEVSCDDHVLSNWQDGAVLSVRFRLYSLVSLEKRPPLCLSRVVNIIQWD